MSSLPARSCRSGCETYPPNSATGSKSPLGTLPGGELPRHSECHHISDKVDCGDVELEGGDQTGPAGDLMVPISPYDAARVTSANATR